MALDYLAFLLGSIIYIASLARVTRIAYMLYLSYVLSMHVDMLQYSNYNLILIRALHFSRTPAPAACDPGCGALTLSLAPFFSHPPPFSSWRLGEALVYSLCYELISV